MNFVGEYRNKVDSKGRIAIPAAFRPEFGGSVMAFRYYADGCIAIYTLDKWNEKFKNFLELPDTKADNRKMIRFIGRWSKELAFDNQGRILIPDYMAQVINLENDAVIVGAIDHLEIWANERWNAADEELTDEEISRISEGLF